MIKRTGNFLCSRLQRFIFGGHRPDFLTIGAQKSGTTSLFNYLDDRRGFLGSIPKEVHFFDREDRFQKGVKWYEKYFVRPPGETEIKNKRSYPSKMSNEDLEVLITFYQQPNKELFDYLGFQPDW